MRTNLDGLHRAGAAILTETAAESGEIDWQHLLLTLFLTFVSHVECMLCWGLRSYLACLLMTSGLES